MHRPRAQARGFLRLMGMLWNDLLAALALVLVIEGMVPFLNPQSLRRMLETVSQLDDRTLRITGLVSMLCGVVMLYIVR
jgi:uncharacterized protein YjeT (DUF2065 family)